MGLPLVDAATLAQFFANGVVYGAILALGAIGLTLVYGILGLSNFAHGDFLTFGAFMVLFFAVSDYAGNRALLPIAFAVAALLVLVALLDLVATKRLLRAERAILLGFGVVVGAVAAWLGWTGVGPGSTNGVLALATLLAVGMTCALTVGLEFAVWRPLRRRRATLLTLVIVSIGLALVVRNGLQKWFGTGNRAFDRPTTEAAVVLGVHVSGAQQFTILATLAVIVATHLFLTRTRTGKAMRALADNFDLARVSGIDVDRVVVYVWVIAGALVAVGGVLLTLTQNNYMNVNMGFGLILPLFASVILGGIGSPYGAMLGGLVVGVAMKTSVLWVGTRYELAAALAILIVVLLVRPQGILGGGRT